MDKKKLKEFIMYIIFGVLTTAVSWGTYAVFIKLFNNNVFVSNLLSWVCAIVFAYITNKLWVFESKSWNVELVAKEATAFVASRGVTGVIEIVCVPLLTKIGFDNIFYNILEKWNIQFSILLTKGIYSKIALSFIIIMLNYVFSKLVVFKNKNGEEENKNENKIQGYLKDNKKTVAVFALTFIAFLFLSYLFPYSGDDWAWGSQLGLDRLSTKFHNYNGRYAGNLLVILLTRSNILKTLTMALSYSLICIYTYKFANKKSTTLALFSVVLFFTLPKSIFVQSLVWTSGYTNYVVPILLIIAYIYMIKNIFGKEVPTYKWYQVVLAVIIGFVAALFMENLTLYSIAMGFMVILISLIKYKKVFAMQIAYFVSAVAGAVVMFSNSSYGIIGAGKDGYRSTGFSLGAVFKHLETITQIFFIENTILLTVITALIVILLIKKKEKIGKLTSISLAANIIALAVFIAKNKFIHLSVIIFFGSDQRVSAKATTLLFICVAMVYMISLFVLGLSVIKENEQKMLFASIYLSLYVIIAPLLVVNPIGPRCFYPPFVMMCIIASMFFAQLVNETSEQENVNCKKIVSAVLLVSIIVAIGYYASIYVPIHRYDKIRSEYAIEQAKTGDEITLPEIPYSSYVWWGNPTQEPWIERYKMFYGIDQSVEIVNQPLNNWLKHEKGKY